MKRFLHAFDRKCEVADSRRLIDLAGSRRRVRFGLDDLELDLSGLEGLEAERPRGAPGLPRRLRFYLDLADLREAEDPAVELLGDRKVLHHNADIDGIFRHFEDGHENSPEGSRG